MPDDQTFQITIEDNQEVFNCKADQNILAAMNSLGRKGIPSGCRSGGCGICRIQIVGEASYQVGKMSRTEVSEEDEANGICLACKVTPQSDMVVSPLGLLRKRLV